MWSIIDRYSIFTVIYTVSVVIFTVDKEFCDATCLETPTLLYVIDRKFPYSFWLKINAFQKKKKNVKIDYFFLFCHLI